MQLNASHRATPGRAAACLAALCLSVSTLGALEARGDRSGEFETTTYRIWEEPRGSHFAEGVTRFHAQPEEEWAESKEWILDPLQRRILLETRAWVKDGRAHGLIAFHDLETGWWMEYTVWGEGETRSGMPLSLSALDIEHYTAAGSTIRTPDYLLELELAPDELEKAHSSYPIEALEGDPDFAATSIPADTLSALEFLDEAYCETVSAYNNLCEIGIPVILETHSPAWRERRARTPDLVYWTLKENNPGQVTGPASDVDRVLGEFPPKLRRWAFR